MPTLSLAQKPPYIEGKDLHDYVGHVVTVKGGSDVPFLVVMDGVTAKLDTIRVVQLVGSASSAFTAQRVSASQWIDHGKLKVVDIA